jgi:hypothetical protein
MLGTVVRALKDGLAQAIIAAQSTFPDPAGRSAHLGMSAFTLIQMRRYDVARPLMAATARLSGAAAAALERFDRLRRHDEALFPPTDPRAAVQRVLSELFLSGSAPESLKPILRTEENAADWDSGVGAARAHIRLLRRQFSPMALTDENIADLLMSDLAIEKDGDDETGYRITCGSGLKLAFYVVREAGQYRIFASSDSLDLVGERVLELLRKKDIKRAQWWLDHIVKDMGARGDGTGFPAARSLWSGVTPATRSAAAITTAAASLIGRYSGSEKAIHVLSDARLKTTTDVERSQIDVALCEAFLKAGRYNDLLAAAKRLSTSRLFAEEGFRYGIKAATAARNWKELQLLAEQRLKSNPQNTTAMRAAATARRELGDTAGAALWAKKMTDSTFGGEDERIFAAWSAISSGKASRELLDSLTKAGGNSGLAGRHYTVAMLQAALALPDAAHRSLKVAIDQEDYDALGTTPWVVFGKICELYGFSDEATAAYERARTAPNGDPMDRWALALIPRRSESVEPRAEVPMRR